MESEAKEWKGGFLGMFLGTLAARFLGSALAGKGVIRGGDGVIRAVEVVIKNGNKVTRAGEGVISAGKNFQFGLILKLILKFKNIIKTNLNLMVFSQEMICLK